MNLLAIDVGGTNIKAEVLDADLNSRARLTFPTPAGAAAVDTVINLIRELAEPQMKVGLAIPGMVDAERGIGVYSANLGWRNLPFARLVSEATGLDTTLVHDVFAGGSAEFSIGAGRGSDDAATLVIGTGIGASLMVEGHHLRHAGVGEIGHIAVGRGDLCRCGRQGCLETVASAAAIRRRYEEQSGVNVSSTSEVVARIPGDPVAAAVWREAISALTDGILVLAALLGTRRIVLSGGLSKAGQALTEPVERELKKRVTVEELPEVVIAAFTDRSVLIGAALAARDSA